MTSATWDLSPSGVNMKWCHADVCRRAVPMWMRHPRPRLTPSSRLAIGISLLTLSACQDATAITGTASSMDPNWFTPAVAARLTSDNLFPGARPEVTTVVPVTLDAARALANAWVRTVGVVSAPFWSDDAGVTVTSTALVPCGRIDFVESAYEEISATRSPFFRNAWGPHWLVRYCQHGRAAIVEVSVAANAADLAITDDGRLDLQSVNAAFNDHGIAQNSRQYPSVEDGARFLASVRTGLRISALPRLVHAGRGTPPWIMSWVFEQADATAQGSRTSVFGASKMSLIARPLAETTAESDTLFDIADQPDRPSIPVIITRRATALQISDVVLFLSQNRG